MMLLSFLLKYENRGRVITKDISHNQFQATLETEEIFKSIEKSSINV